MRATLLRDGRLAPRRFHNARVGAMLFMVPLSSFPRRRGVGPNPHLAQERRDRLRPAQEFLDRNGHVPRIARLVNLLRKRQTSRKGPASLPALIVCTANENLEMWRSGDAPPQELMDLFVGSRLQMPPLRNRQEDIEALARLALRRAGRDIQIEPAAMEWLKRQHWHGNVAEFMQVVGARAKSCLGNEIVVADLETDSALISTPTSPAGPPLLIPTAQSEELSARTEKPSANVFKQQPSGMWHVVFNGEDLGPFTHTIGMHYIAFLLSRPGDGHPISGADLYHKFHTRAAVPPVSYLDQVSSGQLASEGLSKRDGRSPGGEILDERYKRELAEAKKLFEVELQAARQANEVEKVEELEEKLEKIRNVRFSQSRKGVGSKRFQDPGHTDHTRIANALETCYRKLGANEGASLARHLRNCIKSQGGFAYLPDSPVAWET